MADTAFALKAHTTRVVIEIERLKRAFPELAEDLELLSGTIEGQTDFDELVDAILDQYFDRVSMKEAAMIRKESVEQRIARFDKAAELYKALMFDLMKAGDKTMVRRPLATLSVSKGRLRVVVDNVDELPQGYVKTEKTALKAELLAALQNEEVPGAHLETGDPTLSIRTK
jgi:hypothetical protein